jgi:hypothetical protein
MKAAASAILLAAAFSAGAIAQTSGGGLAADRDGDGVVSRAEFLAANLARFPLMDKDGDGRLSRAERTPARTANGLPVLDPKAARRAGDGDADGDLFVSRDEFLFNLGRWFALSDKNGDDQLSGDELSGPAPR